MPENTYQDMNVYFLNKENPIILLRYGKGKSKQSLVWNGMGELKKKTNKKLLILKLNNKNFYFYENEIKNLNNEKLKLEDTTKLNYIEQEKLVSAFAKFANQKNLSQQTTSLKLKLEALFNTINFFDKVIASLNQENEDLKKIKSSFVKEVKKLNQEIEFLYEEDEFTDDLSSPKKENTETLTQVIESLEKEIASLDQKDEDLKKIKSSFVEEIKKLNQEIEFLYEEDEFTDDLFSPKKENTETLTQVIESLEKEVKSLRKENKNLKKIRELFGDKVKNLKIEVQSVIKNVKTLEERIEFYNDKQVKKEKVEFLKEINDLLEKEFKYWNKKTEILGKNSISLAKTTEESIKNVIKKNQELQKISEPEDFEWEFK